MNEPFLGAAAALAPFFHDPDVTDLLVNGCDSFYVERRGALERHPSPFASAGEVFDFLERLCLPLGKRIDATQPYLDGRIGDGARFHAILPPLVSGEAHVSIRKARRGEGAPWESFGDPIVLGWIRERFLAGDNLLVCGATGSGKTTLLTRLLERSPEEERLILIEESREILIERPHVVRLECRGAGPDGVGEVGLRPLVRQALRMRPDRLVLGECRGAEAFDLLLALSTGHRGSATTLHGGSCREALRRLEALVLTAGLEVGLPTVREWIAGALQVVVRVERRPGGAREVAEVACLQGLEGEVYRLAPRFGEGLSSRNPEDF